MFVAMSVLMALAAADGIHVARAKRVVTESFRCRGDICVPDVEILTEEESQLARAATIDGLARRRAWTLRQPRGYELLIYAGSVLVDSPYGDTQVCSGLTASGEAISFFTRRIAHNAIPRCQPGQVWLVAFDDQEKENVLTDEGRLVVTSILAEVEE